MLKGGVILAGKPASATKRWHQSIVKDEGGRMKDESEDF
jgi:hypothetical protein